MIKIKKGLTMLISAMVALGIICLGGGATADDRNIGSSFTVSGAGIIDTSLEVNTGDCYSGLALSQYLYTPSLGMAGPSVLQYTSIVELAIYNVSEGDQTQDLKYAEDGMASNVRHAMYIKNYAIGSVAGFKYTGNGTQEVEAYADNALSEITIGGQIEGMMKLHHKVVDTVTRDVLTREVNEMEGRFKYTWNARTELIDDGKPRGDWLGCP